MPIYSSDPRHKNPPLPSSVRFIPPHRKASRLATPEDIDRIANECMKMVELFQEFPNCVGIAHPQIEEKDPLRFFLTKDEVVINPVMTRHGSYTVPGAEGCMSYQGRPHLMKDRYHKIDVSYQTLREGKLVDVERTVSGYMARIFQHEMDHLDGRYCYDVVGVDVGHPAGDKHVEQRWPTDKEGNPTGFY